ncbi:MAG: UDP-N-acetylmuramoyl-L-alanyl-D-glutamate--2,6-diaminopimelate ligase [Candidatus Pacebacteria bacterium]|nr:UDP-N-acetylmuramoyl-L-alanyl-D-glutamate--2,6-diaminopimelate ligase [Candidatus Paceibacterota bacterium]
MKELIKRFIPPFLLSWYHYLLVFSGALVYGFPSRKLIVIGVTGTKGKSTVVEFCHQIFLEAGFKVASLSSIRFKINNAEKPNNLKMTMPGRLKIQKFLKEAVVSGCKFAILEVTSEGIIQHRHRFINFNTAVFTNLSPEHIERHGGFENYKKAKGRLFQAVKGVHIINRDDKYSDYFMQFSARKKYTYGLEQGDINNRALELKIKLLGSFNTYNALAAISAGVSQGINLGVCKKAVEKIEGLPGRMEVVAERPFRIIVDYAHVPDALEKVYKSFEFSRKICVLGSAGGGRDKWKRPKMGEIAENHCQEIILTNEDPYDEDPEKITQEIISGIKDKKKVRIILDRREAIREAITSAMIGDAVLTTGKGCEPWMCVKGGKKIPWDDRKIAKEELSKLLNS